jgi:hypothetical protein
MPNDECLRNDEIRMTKRTQLTFVIRHSSFFSHSSLDIRHLHPEMERLAEPAPDAAAEADPMSGRDLGPSAESDAQ